MSGVLHFDREDPSTVGAGHAAAPRQGSRWTQTFTGPVGYDATDVTVELRLAVVAPDPPGPILDPVDVFDETSGLVVWLDRGGADSRPKFEIDVPAEVTAALDSGDYFHNLVFAVDGEEDITGAGTWRLLPGIAHEAASS